jgi:hypothetical protein
MTSHKMWSVHSQEHFSRHAVNCQVTESPRLYVLFRTAVPGILPVTRLPFVGFVPVAE